MSSPATCSCETCSKCVARAAKRRYIARKRAGLALTRRPCGSCGAPTSFELCYRCKALRVRAEQERNRPQAQPVSWSEWLTAIREAAGGSRKGTCVAIFDGGRVRVDRVASDPLVFASVDDALDHFTRVG